MRSSSLLLGSLAVITSLANATPFNGPARHEKVLDKRQDGDDLETDSATDALRDGTDAVGSPPDSKEQGPRYVVDHILELQFVVGAFQINPRPTKSPTSIPLENWQSASSACFTGPKNYPPTVVASAFSGAFNLNVIPSRFNGFKQQVFTGRIIDTPNNPSARTYPQDFGFALQKFLEDNEQDVYAVMDDVGTALSSDTVGNYSAIKPYFTAYAQNEYRSAISFLYAWIGTSYTPDAVPAAIAPNPTTDTAPVSTVNLNASYEIVQGQGHSVDASSNQNAGGLSARPESECWVEMTKIGLLYAGGSDRSNSSVDLNSTQKSVRDHSNENLNETATARYETIPSQSSDMEQVNGATNGTAAYTGGRPSMSFSMEQQTTVLHESITITRRKFLAEIEDVHEHDIHNITIDDFLEFIERQRLTHMPHRGSHWDKVLKWAEFFALQISGYSTALKSFVPESKAAAQLIWTASQSLLRLGPDNAQALTTTFGVFYRLGLSISMLLRDNVLLSASNRIRSEVSQAFNTLLVLVREVSLYYNIRLRTSAHGTSFDFNGVFGGQIAAFHKRKNHIIDAMWEQSLGNDATIETRSLRKWLGPGESGMQKLLKADDMAPGDRDEYTCEWFQSHLLAYSRSKDDMLAIHGPPGCGKSVLSTWIVERLQRPIGKKSYVTLSCTVEADTPSEATTIAIVKRLLRQLLEIDVGNKNFHDELAKTYRASMTHNPGDIQKKLWSCLETGLRHIQKTNPTMIVIDGLDAIPGGEKAAKPFVNELNSLAVKHSQLQVITTGSTPPRPDKGTMRPFEVTSSHTHEDLRIVIDRCLQDYKHFQGRSEHAREHLVEQVLHASRGNFLWAILTTVLLKRENSEDGFNKAVKAAKEATISLDETVLKLISLIDFTKGDTNTMLSLMLVADRPLTTTELKCLLQIDLTKRHSVERKSDMVQDLRGTLGSLIVIRDGFVRFAHPLIRAHFLKIQDEAKKIHKRSVAQVDMAKRLLAYCNFNIIRSDDPVMDPFARAEADKIFSTHALLEYAVRNWVIHFRSSAMCHSPESFQLDDDFKAIFPTTTRLPLLEWACWGVETVRSEATESMELSLRIRKAAFSEQHVSTLQAYIICGSIWRETTATSKAADYFYHASIIGQQVLRKYHSVVAACTTTFLTITETATTLTRTELVTRKEKLIMYAIDLYKYQHGKTHDLVIRYYKMLAQLYTDIHEEHKAESVWRELREITIIRFGKGSQEETSISENLTIVLKKGDKKTDVIEYEQGIFEIITELEVWNVRRVKLTIELALSYEARGEFLMAEELFVFLWRRLTEECHHTHHHHGVEIHVRLLEVVIEYTRFLRRYHRHEEACNVLICVWSEYEEYDFESEELFLQLKVIGELMRSVRLLSVAVTVFKKCLSWFRSRRIQEHVISCEVLVSETVEEITTTTVTTTTSTTTLTRTETIIKETFESVLSRTTVTAETISVCRSLVSHYMKLEQWSEAIEVTKRSLMLIWRSVISGGGTIALPKDFGIGAIELAISLAICHRHSGHVHEAEEIYVRIYRACRNSCRIDDERLIRGYKVLIEFYEEHHSWHKMIEIYKELLVEYRNHLGPKHHLTIQTLYILGSLCADHGFDHAHHFYGEILDVLNHGSHVCHADALAAMFYMCRYHYEAGHWHKLQVVCKILWETWKGRHHGHDKFTVDVVEVLYFRYRYVLEHHVHCEFSVLHALTLEYRNICLKIFGAAVAITIKALIELAHICMRSEKHIHEALSYYEEVITQTKTTTTTTVSTTTVTSVKQRLTEAYLSVCSHESVSIATIERAIKVVTERYEYLRLTYGWAHGETLVCLREIVQLHLKMKKQESTTIVMRLLQEATVQIVLKEKHSHALFECGQTLGQTFISCGMNSFAMELIHELRLQLVTGHSSAHNKHALKMEKSSNTVCFVFLVALEHAARGALAVGYSQVMADYLAERLLYESYHRSLKSETIMVVGHAARLRAFLVRHERHGQVASLDHQSYDIFVKKWAIHAQSREIGLLFYVSLLVEVGDTMRDIQIGNLACSASVSKVRLLLEAGQVQKAYEIAECAFKFIKNEKAYHHLQNVPAGFKLSALMAGRDVDEAVFAKADQKLREHMLELSRNIIGGVLQACKDSNIEFTRLKMTELNDLVGLLGEQHNYADLEWILELLWKSREVQKNWKPATIIAIGRRFVQARYLNAAKERKSAAIRLCEDICYNMRRTWGSLDPKTLEMSDLLSQLYTSMGHYREAQDLHENILRLVVEGDDGDDRTHDTMDSATALDQITLLKQSYLRLRGWNKSPETYIDLISDLKKMPEYKDQKEWKQLTLPNEWNSKETPSETLGRFFAPKEWDFARPEDVTKDGNGIKETPSRPGMGVKRAT
ncbi:MAG: hypothetical protein Q9218_006359, partial [Villophora microphyllina]